jgi:predicted transport protein
MSDIKLFHYTDSGVKELESRSASIEKSLQNLIELHMETILGVRLLASEYPTGKVHRGRIDSLGIDENNCPVIIEYKRSINENVINQGLFYLDWLLDHKAEFKLLVIEKLGIEVAEQVEWPSPRLLCIASDFTRYDTHAVSQINRNIELLRYQLFQEDLLLMELVNAISSSGNGSVDTGHSKPKSPAAGGYTYKTVTEYLKEADQELTDIYEAIKAYCLNLGDDAQEKSLKYYIAFKRIKNFVCFEIQPKTNKLIKLYLKVDPTTISLEKGYSRDVRNIGHFGTGDLELSIRTMDDFIKAQPLIQKSYEQS